ncbi:TetR family transcriptional regulator [Mycolicibacterium duvalii]|uniref:Transcriptional regulator n=1 Tax=Mycolicibacterium duvalii TaxID=39688 RepID=A0A7I7K6Z9_9MYCO|nr:TetR/AcrR family transcriptional regulator [Mycolicibacterium duvalii]MCV7368787.1 TetR/AcrR family transcriptional regulator [Mycolicibacterium duvalii]PEG44296.1 TetR family transcriptional regulator [Mycolicibacterium duvalii]BBX19318.1 transcriptional regulator [Mycolicibacterium duvalii]
MGAVKSREAFFEIGLEVLADLGYGRLKLAVVCQRLGVTTGSFYHYFSSWSAYTRELVEHWQNGMTVTVVEAAGSETDPRARIDRLIQSGLTLPHGAEGAIRAWSAVDPDVRAVQAAVDRHRFDALYACALQILSHPRQAQVFAAWGMYLLVGYEQVLLPADLPGLGWMVDQMLDALDSGRFSSVPDDG